MKRTWIPVLLALGCGGDGKVPDPTSDAEPVGDADTDSDADTDADTDTDTDGDTDPGVAPCPEVEFVGTPRRAAGDTSAMTDDWTGTCGGAGGRDVTARFVAGDAGRYLFTDEGSAFDGVLYVTEGCGGPERGCDDGGGPGYDQVVVTLASGEEVIAVADGADASEFGAYTLTAVRLPEEETDCEDGQDEDFDGVADCDDADCDDRRGCRDTAPDTAGARYFEVGIIEYSAAFGYDAALALLVDVTTPYGTIAPNLTIHVGEPEWETVGFDPTRTDLYCSIVLPLTDPTFAPWAAALPNVWYGVEYAGDPPISNCTVADGFEVDPAFLAGSPDLATMFTSYGSWGVAVGAPSPYMLAYLAGYPYGAVPPGVFVGGVVQDGLLGYEVDMVITTVEELDPAYNTLGTYVPAGSVQVAPTVATGFYQLVVLYHVVFA